MPEYYCPVCYRIIEEEAQYCEITDCPHRNKIDEQQEEDNLKTYNAGNQLTVLKDY